MSDFHPLEVLAAGPDMMAARMGARVVCPHPLASVITLRDFARAAAAVARPDKKPDDLTIGNGLTAEFAGALQKGAAKVVADAYAQQRQSAGFLVPVAVRDFKPALQQVILGNASLEKVSELGEIQQGHCQLAESVGTAVLQSYAKILTLTRMAIQNDTFGGFARATWAAGASAARTEAGLVVEALTGNPALPDGSTVFDLSADIYGNVLANSLDATGLGLGLSKLRQQISGFGVATDCEAKYLVCSPELEYQAHALMTLCRLPVTVVAMAGLPAARWFLLGAPEIFPCDGSLQLQGYPQIRVDVKTRDSDAIALRVVADIGAQMIGRVGICRCGPDA